uniref:Uncharacterized protein n=1 Tax=Neovison vison TaxID=452646 RepID=A0A8C7B6T0_NEOVI
MHTKSVSKFSKCPFLGKAAVTQSLDWPYFGSSIHLRVDLVPLIPAEIPRNTQSSPKSSQSRRLGGSFTVKEAVLNDLVAPKVWMYFCVSKIIGMHGVIGYNVQSPIINI